jgi:hypothetical protein
MHTETDRLNRNQSQQSQGMYKHVRYQVAKSAQNIFHEKNFNNVRAEQSYQPQQRENSTA